MPHYQDGEGRVYWFDAAPGADARDDLVAITDQDAATLLLPSLDTAKAAVWARVKATREAKTDAPGALVATPFGVVQSDATSQRNITGLVTMALIAQGAGAPFSAAFTLADNSVVSLSAPKMIGLGVAVGQHVEAVYARARVLRDAIESAADQAALDAIDIDARWP